MDDWYVMGTGAWQGLGWWNTANALEAVIDYSSLRPMSNVNQVIYDVYENRKKDEDGNFINYYYDDEGWWALTWLKAYDKTGDVQFLNTSKSIFQDMTGGWDEEVCTGGLWWSRDRAQKNAIENELFITLGAKLYLRTSDTSYLTWAKKCWNWFQATEMLGPSGLINDGVDLSTCKNNDYPTWTYNQGVILGGLVDLYNATQEQEYLSTARTIASSAMRLLVNDQGVLIEPCESSSGGCGEAGPQFKGIFARYLSYFYGSQKQISLSGITSRDVPSFLSSCETFFATQSYSIWNNDRDVLRNALGLHWAGPYIDADASTQSSALDALNAAAKLQ
jgi:predicted alpha-1,6-mannanase (GH76 family)